MVHAAKEDRGPEKKLSNKHGSASSVFTIRCLLRAWAILVRISLPFSYRHTRLPVWCMGA